jgi:streptogramin lyase
MLQRLLAYTAIGFACFSCVATRDCAAAAATRIPQQTRHSIAELTPIARIHLGKAADWVAITDDAVWVGTKQPNGVAQIDPRTNVSSAAILLPGNPCAGIAVGFGALWVPLCAKPNALARIDLQTHGVAMVPGVGTAAREGGITVSKDSVWLVIDNRSTLARIDPSTLLVEQKTVLPRGSLNLVYGAGLVWVTRPTGAEVTAVDAAGGAVVARVPTGPRPRFLDTADDIVWTLNQGDGTLTRVDAHSRSFAGSSALHTPGPGGDIKVGRGIVWTTMAKVPLSATDARTGKVLCQWVGPGGDSLGVSDDSIWLTDYDAGDVVRFALEDVLAHCAAARQG